MHKLQNLLRLQRVLAFLGKPMNGPFIFNSYGVDHLQGIQTLVNKGAEIEHVAQKLGHWYGLVSDIKEAERESEKPPLFKKLFDGESVEQQALNSVIAQKKGSGARKTNTRVDYLGLWSRNV